MSSRMCANKLSNDGANACDGIDRRRMQWASELPDVDTMGMAVFGRARLVTLAVRGPIEDVLERHGIDSGEADVLFTLLRSGPPHRMRPTELFRSLMITSGGLTQRLNRLESRGLIRRMDGTSDKRSVPVELTEAGVDRARAAFRDDMALEAQLLSGLTGPECAQLAGMLRKLMISLKVDEEWQE